MSRTFRFDKCPFDDGVKIYSKGSVTFEPGVTVLVGCNGAGKTTLLHILEDRLRQKKIPCMFLDSLSTATNLFGNAIYTNNFRLASCSSSSSEGEKMMLGIGQFASGVRSFIMTGRKKRSRFEEAFGSTEEEITTKERWILIDSADSGLSIDSLAEVNDFLHLVREDAEENGYEAYIVVSTNQYELTVGNRCMNSQTLKPVSVKSYAGYRNLILKSRKLKDDRDRD